MKIIADKEGQEAIQALCDLALKVGGLNNLDAINKILSHLENMYTKQEEE